MRYDREQLNIVITAGELTELAGHFPPGEPACGVRRAEDGDGAVLFSAVAEEGGIAFRISGGGERQKDALVLRYLLPPGCPADDDGAVRRCRGESFLSGWLCCRAENAGAVTLHTVLIPADGGEEIRLTETAEEAALAACARRALRAAVRHAGEEIDRVRRRLPTMKDAAFPYPAARPGQKELMQTVFSAVKQGRTLFACAPTGTGKTVSTLFPAVRALGAGACDKVFYLTPKTTSARMAEETVRLLASRGVLLRGVRLSAKQTWCRAAGGALEDGGHDCRRCPLGNVSDTKLRAAAAELYAGDRPLPTAEEILSEAKRAGVCPYELTLACADLADVVIGDYNYLFDPRVALRRYFSPGAAQGRRFAVLVDEAHNLPERARETFSVTLRRTEFAALLLPFFGEESLRAAAEETLAVFDSTVADLLRDELRPTADGGSEGFSSQSNPPTRMTEALAQLADAAMTFLFRNRARHDDAMRRLRDAAYEVQNAAQLAAGYDAHYVTYAMREGGEDTLSLYCVDPAACLTAQARETHALIYFSATLAPPEYYRAVLGGDAAAITEDVPSPFDPDRLAIAVMDKISTRYSEREETLAAVVKVIIETLRGKRGNYMVFCPSFRYMEAVADLFHRAAPKIPIAVQQRHMSAKERDEYLAGFREDREGYYVGFAVMGGIYAEGIDLAGDRLIGAVVVGIGIPQLSPERAMIESYYQCKCDEGKEYAYLYPGMNRVLQAAGRVIRREEDRGVLVLIDERFRDPVYRKIIPAHWRGLRYAGDLPALREHIRRFWAAQNDAPSAERTKP